MQRYSICVTEILAKIVTVDAENADDAREIAEYMYRNYEIELNDNDFMDYELEVLDELEECI